MNNRPKKVIVFRHAEKPLQEGDQRLAPTGVKRAQYIAHYIPTNFGEPDIIFATEPTKSSFRPFLTVEPLWESVKKSFLDVSVADDAAFHLGHHIKEGSGMNTGQNIVVCWHHGRIPELLKGLGAKHHEYPDPWPENDFSTVLVVTYNSDGEAGVSTYQMLF
jgi:phosphohistidine phosphatase SixA